jgi:hypothetical protein
MRPMMVSAMDAIRWDLGNRGAILWVASQHPKEALFQIGSSILNIVTSYHRISGDHLAEHMIHLSTASSFCSA